MVLVAARGGGECEENEKSESKERSHVLMNL